MIYPVVVKKISVSGKSYCGDNGTRYLAFSPLTETIYAIDGSVEGVLKKITSEFAARVFDPQIEIDVIIVGGEGDDYSWCADDKSARSDGRASRLL